MPPEQRRAAIIEATIPLIQESGPNITTRQVADACGVAEGTIFRVFDSLQHLIMAAIRSALSRERLVEVLTQIEIGDNLEEKTLNTLHLLEDRLSAIRTMMFTAHQTTGDPVPNECLRDELTARRHEFDSWLTEQFTPHAAQLNVSPADLVTHLRLLATGRMLRLDTDLDLDQSVQLALHGALRKDTL